MTATAGLLATGIAGVALSAVPARAQVYTPYSLKSWGVSSGTAIDSNGISTPITGQPGVNLVLAGSTVGGASDVYHSVFGSYGIGLSSPPGSLPALGANSSTTQYFPRQPDSRAVPFLFQSDANGNTIWHSMSVLPGSITDPRNAPSGERDLTITIPNTASAPFTGLEGYGVSEIHTLINSYWGRRDGTQRVWIDFIADDGFTWTKVLNPGPADFSLYPTSVTTVPKGYASGTNTAPVDSDFRDVNFTTYKGRYSNVINGTTTFNAFLDGLQDKTLVRNYMRLDKQTIALPGVFLGKRLTQVVVHDLGNIGVQRVFLSGMTARQDITNQISLTPLQVYSNSTTKTYLMVARLTNTGLQALPGPVSIVLNNSDVTPATVSNLTGTTSSVLPGSPYVDAISSGSTLLPGQSVIVEIRYVGATTPVTVAGGIPGWRSSNGRALSGVQPR